MYLKRFEKYQTVAWKIEENSFKMTRDFSFFGLLDFPLLRSWTMDATVEKSFGN